MKIDLVTILNEQRRLVKMLEDMIEQEKTVDSRFITAKELTKIFNLERSAIRYWINKGFLVDYKQERKGCNMHIPYKEIDRLVEDKLKKYSNCWINYKIDNGYKI